MFDFLGYQARYQWNDIRGYNEDKNNPEEKKRGRLPHIAGKEKLSPKLSFAVAAYRLLFAVVICWCNPLNVGFQLFICLLAIFVIAAVYEYARSKSGTLTILMLVLVSLGYPLRIFVGLWVACPNLFSMLSDSSNVLIFVLLTVASILFGMVFVGLTWALEGADHHIKRGAKPYHKHHVDELALKLPGVFDELYPLKNIRPVFAIWNIAMCLSTLLMCAVLVFLAPEMGLGVLACSLFIGWFLCMWIISDPTPGAIYMVVGIMLIVGSMFCLFFYFPQSGLSSRDSTLWCFVAIGLAVYLLIYTGFRNTNYEEMNSSLDNVKKAVASLYKALIGAIIGRQMVELLQGVDTAEGSNINKEKSNS